MRLLVFGIILLAGSSLACPPGKLAKLSEGERKIRITQWEDGIDRIPDEKEKPGRRAKLRDETGLSEAELKGCRIKNK